MQTYINSFQIIDRKFKTFKIFGYSSKGMPGVEVVGFGKQSRLLKEKLIYFTKTYGIRVSNRKYVICLEEDESRVLQNNEMLWFEVPSLILLWTLADVFPLKNINECFCSGKLRATGEIEDYQANKMVVDFINFENKVLIQYKKIEGLRSIVLSELIKESIEGEKMNQAG